MFWQRKPKIDWLHLIFWAALFIAVMSAVALVLLYTASMLANDWEISIGSKDGNKTLKVEATVPGAAAVSANYAQEISTLVGYVSSTTDVDMAIRETVRKRMSEIRVPLEKRDDHLKIYLNLTDDEKKNNFGRDQIKDMLIGLIK